ncbi:MAG: ABC transporter permease [Phycisphaeraceae bacterium]|nr:MAG: ABC transporter permease [Phycisphaeraceae bacterium]
MNQPKKGWLRRLLAFQESGLVLVIVLMAAALTLLGGTKLVPKMDPATNTAMLDPETGQPIRVEVNRFLDTQNIVQNANTASYIAVMAVGMTAIIALAGIDLSIGSIYALAALCGAFAMRELERSTGLAVALPVGLGVCMCVGAIAGMLNGAMVVGLRVHPFIITLGTMAIYRGVAFVMSGGQTVSGFPESVQRGFFKFTIGGVQPVPSLLMVVTTLVGWFVMSRTVLGRRVYAIGGNEVAARYAGIPVGRVKIIAFTIAGMLAGLAACMYAGYFGAATSDAGTGYELRVIAAAVIGGASLSGGRGSALGAALGAIVIQLIDNGMIILQIDQSYNQIVMGAAIVIAVLVDQAKSNPSAAFAVFGRLTRK